MDKNREITAEVEKELEKMLKSIGGKATGSIGDLEENNPKVTKKTTKSKSKNKQRKKRLT